MKGVILGLDMETGGLTILGHDDKRYHLQKSEWRSANEPKAGMEIDFMPSGDNSAKEVYCFRSCVENRGDASRKSAPSDGLVQDASPREWFYALKNTQCGPVSEQSLIDRIKSKELTAMTPIWTKGMPKWVLIKNTDFSAYLHQSDSDQGDLLVDQRGVQTQPVVQIADNGAAPPTSESESSTQWYYAVDDNRHGPVPEQNLIDKIKSGELGRNSKIWKEGLPRWILVENSDFKKYCPTIGPPLLDAPDDPKSHSPGKRESTLEEIQKLICTISGLPPLENFRWRNLFSQALKFKGREEMDRYFNCGCSRTTPTLAEIQVRWPQPWAFSQVLLLGLLVLAGFYVCVAWFQNPLAGPGWFSLGLSQYRWPVWFFFLKSISCEISRCSKSQN